MNGLCCDTQDVDRRRPKIAQLSLEACTNDHDVINCFTTFLVKSQWNGMAKTLQTLWLSFFI